MKEFLLQPTLWIGLLVVVIAVVAVFIIISGRRSREVKKLDNLFPEGRLSGESLEKIPVEKVRRTTIERERRKKEREKHIPKKIRPKKGSKLFKDEDQEFIMTNLKQNQQEDKVLKPRKQTIDEYEIQEPAPQYEQSPFATDEQMTSEWGDSSDKQGTAYNEVHATSGLTRRMNKQQQTDDYGLDNTEKTNVNDSFSSTSAPFSRSNKTYSTQTQTPFRSEKTNLSRSQKNSQQNTKEDTTKQPTRSRVSKYSSKRKFF